MKTARKVLIILLLVGVVVATLALLLVGAAVENQELLMDLVVSNVDGHPTIDGIVEEIPNDCLKCHSHQDN